MIECKTCSHQYACEAWIRHCSTIYDDFSYSVEGCPYYRATSTKAIYAGSFDPFTNGHLDIIVEAASIFDEVLVVVSKNSKKQKTFQESDMCYAIDACIKTYDIQNVKVILSDKLIADIAMEHNVTHLVRGLRNTTDFMYEEEIAKFNSKISPLKTVYLRAKDEAISSSMVRELHKYGKDVRAFVPREVLKVIHTEQ